MIHCAIKGYTHSLGGTPLNDSPVFGGHSSSWIYLEATRGRFVFAVASLIHTKIEANLLKSV